MFSYGISKIFKNTYFDEHLQMNSSETCSFALTVLFDNLHFRFKLVPVL